ncbi:MAG: protein phosphatase 2C domain-containing protein [Saccharofermentans sp.]|nr:protein phosphatase 2C domain-containing protein [Saccharofermentans sp.]
MYTGITVGCVTTIGRKHISREVPCEDASFAVQKNGVSVVCIADGAGGKKYTHARFGSACAVELISDILTEHFDALYAENREAAVRSYFMAKIRIAFADIMAEKELDTLDQLSCTLLFVAVKDRRMIVGHLGDGLVVRISPSGLSPFSMPQNEKDGTTFFITAGHAADYMRFIKTTVDDCHAVALMTDGVQDNVYDEDSGLVKPVVAKMAETFKDGREKGETAIKEILEKYIVGSSNVSDDSSFGVLLLEGTQAPDVSSLESSAEKFGKSEENFMTVAKAIKDDLMKASEIISKAAEKSEEEKASETAETAETESSAETKEPEEETKPEETDKVSGKKNLPAILLGIACVIELIIIILLIIIRTRGVV